jgi:TolB-like protein
MDHANSIMSGRRYRFGSFVLETARGVLFHHGSPIAISNRGLALLQALMKAKGDVLTKSALMDAVWPNTIVEESNLTVQIAALRKFLGPPPGGGEWIATIARVGYRFIGASLVDGDETSEADAQTIAGPSQKPSIAVLPFINLSSDPEQEYFVAGLTEDLITDLSKVPGLLVIARNSSFAYRGNPVDVRVIARELGVHYIVEGSVRRAASRVRINAELVDATDNSHVWADRFDRDLSDIFGLQDEVVGMIMKALSGAVPSLDSVGARRATNLEAYDAFVRGRVLVTQLPEGNRASRPLLERSIELDPNFADAHAWLAMSHVVAWLYYGEAIELHRPLARASAERAVVLDATNATAHTLLAYVLMFDGKLDQGASELATALRLNPNHADAWTFLGELHVIDGKPLEGIEDVRRALRLNPYPPGYYYWIQGFAQYSARLYEEAVETLRRPETYRTGSRRLLAASLAQLGRTEEAKIEAEQFIASNPHFSIAQWAGTQPFRHKPDLQHFIDGYLKAGLRR